MSAIAEFLKTYSDEALARLSEDAGNGGVPYWSPCGCLVGHHQSGYDGAKLLGGAMAEREYHAMGFEDRIPRGSYIFRTGMINAGSDELRCQRLMPLIEAETQRRLAERAVPYYTPAPAVQEYALAQRGEN